MNNKRQQRYIRHKRIRAKIKGTSKCPRLCVFRSNKHISVQLIDDHKGHTLVSASDLEIKDKKNLKKVDLAKKVGSLISQKAIKNNIEKIVFDRAGYKYHGRVKAIAEGAKEGGLKF